MWPQLVMGAGMSFMFVPLSTITVDPIPAREMGYATSLVSLARNLGAAVGISVFTAFIARRGQFHQERLAAETAPGTMSLSKARSGLAAAFEHQGLTLKHAAHAALITLYTALQRQASVMSYLDGFRIMALLLVVAAPFVWIMRKPRFGKSSE